MNSNPPGSRPDLSRAPVVKYPLFQVPACRPLLWVRSREMSPCAEERASQCERERHIAEVWAGAVSYLPRFPQALNRNSPSVPYLPETNKTIWLRRLQELPPATELLEARVPPDLAENGGASSLI